MTSRIQYNVGPPSGNCPRGSPGQQTNRRAAQLHRAVCRLAARTALAAAALTALTTQMAQACDGPKVQGSTVRLNAQLTNVDAEGIVGSSSKSSFLGFGRKKSVQEMPAVVEVGVLSVGCNAALIGSEININAYANGVRLRGGTVRVGGVILN